MKSINVLIVDDHPVVRDGVRGMLDAQDDIVVCGEACDGREAVQLAAELEPDVILMDLRMPNMDGVSATSTIMSQNRDTKILILTTYETDEDIVRAMEAGAIGYMLKDTPRQELRRAVRASARGESALTPTVASRLVDYMRAPSDAMLTTRELAVLSLVALGASNKEIGEKLHISVATVKTHLIHVFGKLQVDNRTAAVTVALEKRLIRL